MAHAGQEIRGPDGFVLRLVRTGAQTGGEVLEMEASYSGTGGMPPAHLHPRQVERFEVLEGAMETVVGEVARRYSAGDVFEVPAGVAHQMAADGPARVRWSVTPALRTAEFFEQLYAALDAASSGGAGGVTLADLLASFGDEIRFTG